MENIKGFLHSMGFGKNETEVYSVLVELGTSSVLEIAKKSKVHRSNIYDALRNLIKEGLVFEVGYQTKKFSARPPESLFNFLKQKESELKNILDNYKMKKVSKDTKNQVKVSKGIFSLREAFLDVLEHGPDVRVFGVPGDFAERIGPTVNQFCKGRKSKIELKIIFNFDGKKYIEKMNKLPFTEARFLPKRYDSYVSTVVSGEKTIIFLWDDETTVIEIDDYYLSDSYSNYFDILWSKAKR